MSEENVGFVKGVVPHAQRADLPVDEIIAVAAS